jgi:stearoyl-CoA desaturase (delta-9 desaturase)
MRGQAAIVGSSPRSTPLRIFGDDARARLLFQKAVLAAAVVIPFLATAIAVEQLWERAVAWRDLALLAGLYVPISLGVTVGYHRMLTHRSFRAHPAVGLALLILGSMALEGSPVTWADGHLKHHALADKPGDPHSPLDGLVHAHMAWMFRSKRADPSLYGRHLRRDAVVSFVDRTFAVWVALSLVVPLMIGGWTGLLWGGLVRIFFVHHVTWSVNSVCHTFGQRVFVTSDRSRNNWLVSYLAMGEGWHNNHHAFPRSAVHGVDRWQVDVSAGLIGLLQRLHLATDVQRVAPAALARKRASAGSTYSAELARDACQTRWPTCSTTRLSIDGGSLRR